MVFLLTLRRKVARPKLGAADRALLAAVACQLLVTPLSHVSTSISSLIRSGTIPVDVVLLQVNPADPSAVGL
jgi:hypothetical protein